MTLYLHRAERADHLVDGLAELLAQPLPDAFADEVLSVPARGVERWISQRLAHRLGSRQGRRDGVCAGVRFPPPRELVDEVVGVVDADPWAPDRLVWPLLEVVDEVAGDDWCRTLGEHLGVPDPAGQPQGADAEVHEARRGRRYAVGRRLAGLFDAYATHRPSLVRAWSRGVDDDGLGRPLPADLGWQPQLWREVAHRVAAPDPVQRLESAVAALRDDPARVALPQRISLFGPTRVPSSHLEVLAALAEHRDVHLWIPHPSPALWRRMLPHCGAGAPVRRRDDPTVLVPRNGLLSSLGRDSRELQLTLSRVPATDVHHSAEPVAATLLTLLQDDLRHDRPGDPARRLSEDDRSVQVHACHGQARQVEVLREVLVGLLAADPTLEPRDVLVMCPDIEVYAPLVAATFGLADVVERGHPGHRLRVRLADRALRQTNPLLSAVATLLDLAEGRVTASQVLDLAASAPVRRRFGLDDDDLEQLATWVTQAGVRWGFDAAHRAPFRLGGLAQNTWRAGLDRLLLGAAMADEDHRWLGLALPLDDVGSGDIDRAGRLAELVSRLQSALAALSGPQTLDHWLDALARASESLTSVPDADLWQRAELRRELDEVAQGAGARAATTVLRLADVRALLASRLGGRPTRANFRTGTLTVCTMVPMRSVPHRVVCLLGLDDGVFPRGEQLDGDDVLARDHAVGERDPRGEDRQLMLDAVLAATEHLVVTYSGADERTGAVRPPAVPLGELLDALDDTATAASGGAARCQVLVRHPLQPYDVRNLVPDELGASGPFSHDPAALAGALAAAGPRTAPTAFVVEPLAPLPAADVELAALSQFVQHPVRAFLRQRLDVAVRHEEVDPSDALPVELDALQRWSVGERLLQDRLAGADEETCRQAEWRRGVLPPGPLGHRILEQVLADVSPLVDGTARLREAARRTADVQLTLPSRDPDPHPDRDPSARAAAPRPAAGQTDRRLQGTVGGLHGDRLVRVTYSKLAAGHRLRAWASLLALAAAHPDTAWTAVVVGRDPSGRPLRSALGPLDAEPAREVLGQLVDLYDRGLREPLPMATKSSAEYAAARVAGRSVEEAVARAGRRWASGRYPGEDAQPAHVQVWGADLLLPELLRSSPRPGEAWAGEPSRFGELALRLWMPLLAGERIGPL